MTPVFEMNYIYSYKESYKALLKGVLGPSKTKFVFVKKTGNSWFPKWKKWRSYYV